MSLEAHKGQRLPLRDQVVPLNDKTVFYAPYDSHLHGYNKDYIVRPYGAPWTAKFINSYLRSSFWSSHHLSGIATIEFWMKATNTSSNIGILRRYLPAIAPNPAKYDYSITGVGGNLRFQLWSNSTTNTTIIDVNSGITYDTNWHHYAWVLDTTNQISYIYKDGELITSISRPTVVPAQNTTDAEFELGRGWDSITDRTMNGWISDVRFWSIVRTQQHIRDNMYADLSSTIETGLLSHWKLNEGFNYPYPDSSIYGNDLYNGSGVTWEAPRNQVASMIYWNDTYTERCVSIDQGTSNIINNAGMVRFSTGASAWLGFSGATVNLQQYYFYPDWGTPTLQSYCVRVQTTGGTDVKKYYSSGAITLPNANKTYAGQIKVKNQGLTDVTVSFGMGDSNVLAPQEVKTVKAIFTWDGIAPQPVISFSVPTVSDNLDLLLYQPQIEEKAWHTNHEGYHPLGPIIFTRSMGKLYYGSRWIDLNKFSMSFWFKAPRIHPNATENVGIETLSYYLPIMEIAPQVSSGAWTGIGFVIEPKDSANVGKGVLYCNSTSDLTTMTFNENQWYHGCIVSNGSMLQLYIDGKLEKTITKTTPTQDHQWALMVGGGYMGAPNTFIKNVRIDNDAIDPETVLAWYYSGEFLSPYPLLVRA